MRRARDARAHARRGPVRLRARAHARRRRGDRFRREAVADQIDTHNISAGIYVLERSVLDLLEPDEPASIERDVFPRLVGEGLYAYVGDGYWLDIGTPERYLEGTFDILEGTVKTAVAERMGDGFVCVEHGRDNDGRVIPSALVERDCPIAAGARIGGRAVLEAGVTVGPNTTIERTVVLRGAEHRRQLPAQRLHRRRGRADRRQHARRGARRAGRGRDDRRRQRRHQRRPHLPRRHDPGRRAPVLMGRAARRGRLRRGRLDRAARPRRSISSWHLRDALWRVDSAAIAPVDAPGGLIVAGMGGSSGRRPARGRRARPRLRRPPGLAMGYDIPAWIGTRDARAVLELLRRDGGDARHLRRRQGGRRAAARRHDRRPLAERARADGVPVVPLPGGFQPRAAVGYSLVTALEAAALCGAAPSLRGDVEGAARSPTRWPPNGAPTAPEDGEAKRLARALHGSFPVITGAGLTAAVAYRWKCQINENAESPAFASELPEHDHNEIVGWAGRRTAPVRRVPRGPERRSPRRAPAPRSRPSSPPRARPPSSASRRAARRGSSGSSRSCCSATSCRSTSPSCAASTRSTSARSTRSRPVWRSPPEPGTRRARDRVTGCPTPPRPPAPPLRSSTARSAPTRPAGGSSRPTRRTASDVVAEVLLTDAQGFEDAAAPRAAAARLGRRAAPSRGRVIAQVGRLVEANKEALARLVTREIGKPYPEALGEVQEIIDTCDFFLGEGRRLYGQTVPSEMPDKQLFTFRMPVGVAAIVTAGNFPGAVPSWYLVPAILCGNARRLEAGRVRAATGTALAQLFHAGGVPSDVLNLVHADGAATFAGLERALERRLVDKVGFTGSSAVGAQIGALCGRHLQSPCLELGGKNPMVVMDDADLDLAVEGALFAGFGTAGQRCTSLGTAIVHEACTTSSCAGSTSGSQAAIGDPTPRRALRPDDPRALRRALRGLARADPRPPHAARVERPGRIGPARRARASSATPRPGSSTTRRSSPA